MIRYGIQIGIINTIMLIILKLKRKRFLTLQVYGISKWGLKGLTEGLGKILIPYGINVNAIAPGSTATGLIGFKEGDSITSNENGMNRLIMPDEVATLAKLLVSDSGKMIDGEVVHISGGRGTFDIR